MAGSYILLQLHSPYQPYKFGQILTNSKRTERLVNSVMFIIRVKKLINLKLKHFLSILIMYFYNNNNNRLSRFQQQ